jgi:2,4-dienoyl-CoA reductase-like NADH-dependent reductase (Old Yellow Enzyme family)
MAHLFEPLTIRGVTLSNRIAVSPMCQYSSRDGLANDWHFVHLATRAVGGAGLVFTEASAVLPEGRISPQDLGIWSDAHADALARAVAFIHQQGSIAGMQLAHAGRKASTCRPWEGSRAVTAEEGGWDDVVAPSAIPFSPAYPHPKALTVERIHRIAKSFSDAAARARNVGFRVLEIHAAHGYLIHEFLSPLSNHRNDEYGGSFENRTRLLREIVAAVREVWDGPLFVRISSTDWVEGGWNIEQSVTLARELKASGVDLIDCSSGGNVSHAQITVGPGYQTAFAERIRRDTGIMTGAVGLITDPVQADHIIRTGQADLVLLAREMLRDPYFPLRAARELRQPATWPVQYLRAAPEGSQARSPVNLDHLKEGFEEQHAVPEDPVRGR